MKKFLEKIFGKKNIEKNIYGNKNVNKKNSEIKEVNIKKLRKDAETLYGDRDFYCSEAVVKVVLDYFKPPFDETAIKLASGFPVGIGGSMCTCGAVNAGVMSIGMFFGRDKKGGSEVKKAMVLSKELYDKFTEKNKVACCKVLTHGKKLGSKEHIKHCVTMTGDVAEITGRILARELGYKIIG